MAAGLVCKVLTVFLLAVTSRVPLEMKNLGYNSSDGSMHMETTPTPTLTEGMVLIKVAAAGVNRLDLSQVEGKYPPPPGESKILGVEVSGVVVEVSSQAEARAGLKKGDKVMALVGGGGYAEYCLAPYQTVMRVPEGVPLSEAAGIPEVFLTAYQALVTNAHLKDGETVLIHAGASGVGLAAIQLCKVLFKGVKIIVTAGSDVKLESCKQYGADVAINYKTQDFAAEVLTATGNAGANVILDFVGASYWEKHVQCIATDGRLVQLGLLGGGQVAMNMASLLKKRVTLLFSTLRSRPIAYKESLTSEMSAHVLPHFAAGLVRVPVDSTFQLEQAAEAHERMRNNRNIGKMILLL